MSRKKKERIEVEATLIRKDQKTFYPNIKTSLLPVPLYEVEFAFDDHTHKIFEVSEFEYHVLEVQERGHLVYEDYTIVCFADKIKEFHLS